MSQSPIALFVYNRPWHTRQTVEALQRNELAKESDLFIFSDAPKNVDAENAVGEVREYIKTIGGFRSVNILKREKNWGLANSIIDGVTRLCGEYGRVIVLEDDLVTAPYFLQYMNDALLVYESENRVMHVSGYMFPIKNPEILPVTFLYRATTCWGWATWKRAWDDFESDSAKLLEKILSQKLDNEFDVQGTSGFTSMLKRQSMGQVDSWAIRWYASVFLKSGLCLHPALSLVSNIGFDGSGVHCDSNMAYAVDDLNRKPINVQKTHKITESLEAVGSIVEFNRSLKRPFFSRVFFWLARNIRKVTGLARS